jgi:hypothetical protein
MRIVLAAALLSGCTTMTNAPEPAAPSEAECDLAPLKALIGQPASAGLGADALRLSGARTLRWKPPGAIVTMDYRPDRLNVSLDEHNRATAFDCG